MLRGLHAGQRHDCQPGPPPVSPNPHTHRTGRVDRRHRHYTERNRFGPVPVHPVDIQHLRRNLPRPRLRAAPPEPHCRRLRNCNITAYSLGQLRHDAGHHPFHSHAHLRSILLLQSDQPADVHHYRGDRLEDCAAYRSGCGHGNIRKMLKNMLAIPRLFRIFGKTNVKR